MQSLWDGRPGNQYQPNFDLYLIASTSSFLAPIGIKKENIVAFLRRSFDMC